MGEVSLIDRLDRWLAANRPAFYKSLRKGAKPAALAKVEKALGPLPPTLAQLFAWRDGGDKGRFQENWSLMAVAEAHEVNEGLTKKLEAGEFDQPIWWKPTWFPFLANDNGDHVCVDLETGEVTEFWHDDDRRTICYPTIDTWLEMFVTTLEAGVWSENKGEYFEPKPKPFAIALKQMCPGFPKQRNAAGPKPVATKSAKSTKAAKPPAAPPTTMDETTAKRLVNAWRAKDPNIEAPKSLPSGGFYVTPGHGYLEAEFDPKQRLLMVRQAPVGFGANDRGDREQLAASVYSKKRAELAGTLSEVVKFRARPKDGWFIVLRKDFGDANVSDADFIAAVGELGKLMLVWRA